MIETQHTYEETGLKRDLQKEVDLYKKARAPGRGIKATLILSDSDGSRAARIWKNLSVTETKGNFFDARSELEPFGLKVCLCCTESDL